MKITEIHDPVMNALRREKFVGDIEVTIYRSGTQDTEIAKITGFKRTADEFPYDFGLKLQGAINEICFRIVSGDYSNEDYTFDIKGRVEYVFEYKKFCLNQKLYQELGKKIEALEKAQGGKERGT